MPLAALRSGVLVWSHRKGLARLFLLSSVAVLALPVLLALVVVAALAGSGATGTFAPGPVTTGPPMPSWVVTQPFGCTGLGMEPRRGGCPHFHYGIDLAAPPGTAVSAAGAGRAEVFAPAGPGGGYGLHIVVRDAGGIETLYGHLQDVAIATGDMVSAGTLLGHEGSTGLSTGPHLHFEVREAGIAVDPTRVFPGIFGPDGQKR